MCVNFQTKQTTLTFWAQICPKMGFWFKISKIQVCKSNFEFFSLNLGKLPNYVQYFGSNIVKGVAESWVEVDGTGWSWVEVDGPWWRWVRSLVKCTFKTP